MGGRNANGDSFTVEDPYGVESIVLLRREATLLSKVDYVPGRKRLLRHLVSCSQELADSTAHGKLLLVSDDQLFIWSSLVCHYGLPATPQWEPWMIAQLQQQKRIQPLLGFGYAEVIVKAKRKELLALLRKRSRSKQFVFPARHGPFNGRKSNSSRRLPNPPEKPNPHAREPTIRGSPTHLHSKTLEPVRVGNLGPCPLLRHGRYEIRRKESIP